MVKLEINRRARIAIVTPRIHEKYARKLLQEKIKKDSGIGKGFEFWYSERLSDSKSLVYQIIGNTLFW